MYDLRFSIFLFKELRKRTRVHSPTEIKKIALSQVLNRER